MRLRRTTERGASLILALGLLFVVAAAGAALCLRTDETVRENVAQRANLAARYAAQAGVEKARLALSNDAAYAGETFRFDTFDVSVAVTSDDVAHRIVRVTATCATARAGVDVKLRLASGLPSIDVWSER
jgi:type II secretory pathway component PulK